MSHADHLNRVLDLGYFATDDIREGTLRPLPKVCPTVATLKARSGCAYEYSVVERLASNSIR